MLLLAEIEPRGWEIPSINSLAKPRDGKLDEGLSLGPSAPTDSYRTTQRDFESELCVERTRELYAACGRSTFGTKCSHCPQTWAGSGGSHVVTGIRRSNTTEWSMTHVPKETSDKEQHGTHHFPRKVALRERSLFRQVRFTDKIGGQ